MIKVRFVIRFTKMELKNRARGKNASRGVRRGEKLQECEKAVKKGERAFRPYFYGVKTIFRLTVTCYGNNNTCKANRSCGKIFLLGRIVEAHGEFHLPWQNSDEDELTIWVSKMNLSSKIGQGPEKEKMT